MLDTRRTPDISDLGGMCRRYLDIAEMLENYACNVTMPNHETSPEAWNDMEKMCSAVSTLTDALREIAAVANVLDGWANPSDYGFPPEPIRTPHTDAYKTGYDAGYSAGIDAGMRMSIDLAKRIQQERAEAKAGQDPDSADGSYLAGYADGLKAAEDTDGKGYTLEDGETLADFARRIRRLTAEQLDDMTADEKKESAVDRLAAILNGFKIDAQFMGKPDKEIIHMIRGAQYVEQEMEKKAKRILEALDAEQPTPDDRKDGAEQ